MVIATVALVILLGGLTIIHWLSSAEKTYRMESHAIQGLYALQVHHLQMREEIKLATVSKNPIYSQRALSQKYSAYQDRLHSFSSALSDESLYPPEIRNQYLLEMELWKAFAPEASDLLFGSDSQLAPSSVALTALVDQLEAIDAAQRAAIDSARQRLDASWIRSRDFSRLQSAWIVLSALLLTVTAYILASYICTFIQKLRIHNADLIRLRILDEESSRNALLENAAKGQFMVNMSHEIRTPLNAIVGMAYLALQGSMDAKSRCYLEKVVRSANAMIPVINDVLDYSKIEAGKLDLEAEEFLLSEVFNQLFDLLLDSAKHKGLSLRLDIENDVPLKLVGDSVRLGQILINLVSNAIKFTSEGEITIGVKLISTTSDVTEILLSVKDHGIGMSSDHLVDIFNPFQQANASTKRRYGGTGLGLAISSKLVNVMGGKIWVESELGIGSNFIFQLPFTPARSLPELASISASASLGSTQPSPIHTLLPPKHVSVSLIGVRVLLADDDMQNLEQTAILLQQYGMEVIVANDRYEALARINADPDLDNVLVDCPMPNMRGFEVSGKFRQTEVRKDVPIIALSVNVSVETEGLARSSDANDFVSKPLHADDLMLVIKRWALRLRSSVHALPMGAT